jgi:hypothetical protein
MGWRCGVVPIASNEDTGQLFCVGPHIFPAAVRPKNEPPVRHPVASQVQLNDRLKRGPKGLRVQESTDLEASAKANASGSLSSQGLKERMKKVSLLFVLLPLLAVAGYAQESRQDASLSVTGIFPPYVYGNTVQQYRVKASAGWPVIATC